MVIEEQSESREKDGYGIGAWRDKVTSTRA